MKSSYRWLALSLFVATPAFAESSLPTITRKTTVQTADGRTLTFTGTVVEYVPGKSIVVRDSNQRLVTYSLTPQVSMPAEVQVGQTVTLYPDSAATGAPIRKVVTTSITPEGDLKTTTESTRTLADGSLLTTRGTVVEYVPSKNIVVRDASDKLYTYALSPDLSIPGDVQVGKTVVVQLNSAGSDGVARVQKVTSTSVTPQGEVQTTTRTTETSASGNTRISEETRIEGVISSYVPSKTVTIQRTDGTTVTYDMDATAVVPGDLVVGRRVALRLGDAGQPRNVRHITYVTTSR